MPDVSTVNLETQPGPNFIESWLDNGTYLALASALAVGPHVLDIYWSVYDVNCTAQVAPFEASIEIGRL